MIASTTVRVLEVLALLLREAVTVEDLINRFNVSRRTVFRYFSAIRAAGFSVDCRKGRYRVEAPTAGELNVDGKALRSTHGSVVGTSG